MKKIFSYSLILFILSSLSGCFSRITTEDKIYMCKPSTRVIRKIINGKEVSFAFTVYTSKPFVQDYSGDNFFSVNFEAYNIGRKEWKRERPGLPVGYWKKGDEGIPIFYDAKNAFIKKESGGIIKSDGYIYIPNTKNFYIKNRYNGIMPDGKIFNKKNNENAILGRIDINSDNIQLSNHYHSGYASVYLNFNTTPPGMDEKWEVHIGDVLIDGETFKVPHFNICPKKGETSWVSRKLQ